MPAHMEKTLEILQFFFTCERIMLVPAIPIKEELWDTSKSDVLDIDQSLIELKLSVECVLYVSIGLIWLIAILCHVV